MKLLALLALVLVCAPLQIMAQGTMDHEDHLHKPSITFAFPTFLEVDSVLESSAARNRLHRKNLRDREAPAHSRR